MRLTFKSAAPRYLMLIIIASIYVACSRRHHTGKVAKSYAIYVQDKGGTYKDALILSRYQGSNLIPLDTALLDNKLVTAFLGKQALADGFYAIGDNKNLDKFDFLISANQAQSFGIRFNSQLLQNIPQFKGSPENIDFYKYLKSVKVNKSDTAQTAHISDKHDETVLLRSQFLNKYTGSMMELFLLTDALPSGNYFAEHALTHIGNNSEASFVSVAVQSYWDQIDLSDKRIINIPLFEQKLIKYFAELIPQDQLYSYFYEFIAKLDNDSSLIDFCSNRLYEFFIHAPYEHYNDFAGNIAEKFILKSKDLDPLKRMMLMFEVQRIKMNAIGDTITNLALSNTNGINTSLHALPQMPSLIYFYDPHCHACQISLTLLSDIYAKYSARLQIVTIAIGSIDGMDGLPNEWLRLVADKEDVYDKFNLLALPSVYLIDKNKKTLARNIIMDELQSKIESIFMTQ